MGLNFFRFITLGSALIFFILASFIYLKDRDSRLHRAFGGFVVFCALWSFGFFLTMFATVPHAVALWSSRISHFFGGLTAIWFLHFVFLFLDDGTLRKMPRFHYILALASGASSLTPWMVEDVVAKSLFPYYPEPGQ